MGEKELAESGAFSTASINRNEGKETKKREQERNKKKI
jgi:hypothetical protein